MTSRRNILLIFVGFAVIISTYSYAECVCPINSIEESVRKADRIFQGRVVSAIYEPTKSDSIEFAVKVDEIIRGNLESEYRLTTSLPSTCGVSVKLAVRAMFILGPDGQSVSTCTGSGWKAYMTYPLLRGAIGLVDYTDSDVEKALGLLNKSFYSGHDRATIDEFFELVKRIDPSGYPVTSSADQIRYRGIVVYFKDDKFEKVGAL